MDIILLNVLFFISLSSIVFIQFLGKLLFSKGLKEYIAYDLSVHLLVACSVAIMTNLTLGLIQLDIVSVPFILGYFISMFLTLLITLKLVDVFKLDIEVD